MYPVVLVESMIQPKMNPGVIGTSLNERPEWEMSEGGVIG
jgi:hypothetical protein